jgi:spore coat polysaccharide biosynthesis protein SpsF
MTTIAVVQARMGSTRFPGKVLADLEGEPLIRFLLRRLRHVAVDHVVVATSECPADDAVVEAVTELDMPVVRGPEHDVLTRFVHVIEAFPADVVVRLTADCPLVDPNLVGAALELRSRSAADYASNTLVRTFPDGLDVEVIRAPVLIEAAKEAADPVEREHVTPFVYRRPERYRLVSLRNSEHLGDERWTVDTPADLEFVRSITRRFPSPTFPWEAALAAVGRRCVPAPGEVVLRPAGHDDSARLLAWRNDPMAVEFSRTGRMVDRLEHDRWVQQWLESPATRVWIGEMDGQAVGQVRIDVRAGIGTVSVTVAPEARGRGHAARLVQALQRALEADHQVIALVAEVDEDNEVSRRAFERAGFAVAARDDRWLTLRWSRPR